MTSFSGSPEFIASMMGLPQEAWFRKLEQTADWFSLGIAPVGDLRETEAVFRAIWANSIELVHSKPRVFFFEGTDHPAALAAVPALRAIGAARLADRIENPPPPPEPIPDLDTTGMTREEIREAAGADRLRHTRREEVREDIRGLLIRYLTARGVFPLEPHDPHAAERNVRDKLVMDRCERVRRMAEQDARDRLQPFPPEKK